jgi:hypothetical protein
MAVFGIAQVQCNTTYASSAGAGRASIKVSTVQETERGAPYFMRLVVHV